LIGCEDYDFLGVNLGRMNHAGDIAADKFKLCGSRESRMQQPVSVTDCARRQWPSILPT
jgi:hypothetical protein